MLRITKPKPSANSNTLDPSGFLLPKQIKP